MPHEPGLENCSSHEGVVARGITCPMAEHTVAFEELDLVTVL